MKFKKGDKVVILETEGRPLYKQLIGKVGTIVDAECVRIPGVERTSYRVRIDEMKNDFQDNGLWVFHEEKSLRHYEGMFVVSTKFNITEIDDIIKGDNMNNILEIYENRKANKLFEEIKVQIEKVKMADPTYKAWKTAVDTINKIYAKDIEVYGEIHLGEPKLSEKSNEKVKELNSSYSNQRRAIDKEIEEIKAQLSICETYEQKQNVLKLYNVIDADGKINA